MSTVLVRHMEGDRFSIGVRDHVVTVDQPIGDGGTDTAPTPTELFVASLTSCVAYYATRYLRRHGLPTDGLAVRADWDMGARPARVADVRICVDIPAGVPVERREALLAVASHCTVHNTLEQPPAVAIELAGTHAVAS